MYTKKFTLDVNAEPLPDPEFIPESDLSFLEIKPRVILLSIQNDLRKALNERGRKNISNYLSDDTITSLKRIDALTKQEDINKKRERDGNIKLRDIIMNVLDKIKTGDYNLVAKFMNYDIKNTYQFQIM